MRQYMRHLRSACLAIVLAATACPLAAAQREWNWSMPVADYKAMGVFERAQYDKAAKLLDGGNAAAAATEFEKFEAQFADSAGVPYVVFLRGYSLQQAKQRNAAIKAYQQVLSFFPKHTSAAAPAAYYTAVCYLANGDTDQGIAAMKAMVDNKQWSTHPLGAAALRTLADYYAKAKQTEEAVRFWKQVVVDFAASNPREAAAARTSVMIWYLQSRNFDGYEKWMLSDGSGATGPKANPAAAAANPARRKAIVESAWQLLDAAMQNDDKDKALKADDKAACLKAFYEYLKSRREWFEKDNDIWGYDVRVMQFTAKHEKKDERDKAVDEAIAYVKKVADPAEADRKFVVISDCLRDAGDFGRASHTLGMLKDRILATYKEHEIAGAQGKWKEAIDLLLAVEGMKNEAMAARAKEARADIYQEHTRQYQEAIKLYTEIDKPPKTLWSISLCYKKWGKLKDALSTLTEIENSFPDQAPEAAIRKATYLEEAGQTKEAIAQERRILKVYPKSGASSRAHQLLEKHGIATGGGVSDEN